MYKSLLGITLLALSAVAAFAEMTAILPEENDRAEQAVLQVVQAWLDADERQDRAALDKIIADDFLGTAPRGKMVNKQDIIPREGTTGGHGLSINAEDTNVRVFGDIAIVTGRGIPKTREPAQRPELRFTIVFVKRSERWQMIAAHLSPIPSD